MRILITVPGNIGERMSGPAIRAWQLARALAQNHDVTAAVEGELPDTIHAGIRTVPATRPLLFFETLRHDAVISSCLPPYALVAARAGRTITVADHYDPVELELATIAGRERAIRSVRAVRRLQHRHADIVLCAGEAQRRVLLEELARIDRVDERAPLVAAVPFGLDAPPSRSDGTPLRDRFPAIASDDRIVLWWGKIWTWFDPETAIRAFEPLARSRPEIKLVLTSGPAPHANTEALSLDLRARAIADQIGLLGKSVFFVDDWIPYAQRHHCLHEADLGLTVHAATAEAKLAARARYMDYLWTGLPCVLTRGDEVAAEFERVGFARLVGARDIAAVTTAVVGLLDDRGALQHARQAAVTLAGRWSWTEIAGGLSGVLRQAAGSRRATQRPSHLAAQTGTYYIRRVTDKVAGLTGRARGLGASDIQVLPRANR